MKILIASDCYIHNMGGVTASVLALCAGLRRQGHEVRTLSLSGSGRSFREGEDVFIRSVPAFYYPELRMSFAVRDPLLKELEEWGPDLVHAQTEGSACRLARGIAKRRGVPFVMTCHTDYAFFIFGKFRNLAPLKALAGGIGKALYRSADRITVPSLKARNFPLLRAYREKITVVPNGMEAGKYRSRFSAEERQAFRQSLGIGEGTGVLVAVTRLSREKNIRELISCLPALLGRNPDVRLLIAGDGPDRKRLEKAAAKQCPEGQVIFAGRVPAEEVWRFYAAGDVFVSASLFEVHSMSCLEAMAAGLPLLCREDEALAGVLEQGRNGLAYRSREEFTEYAARLLGDAGYRETLARGAVLKAEEFTMDSFASAMLRVYEEAVRPKD